jgi:hypothetical protein
VDRARQVCAEYRRALAEIDPSAADVIDRAAIAAGETWVNPGIAIHDEEDLVTVIVAADLVGRSAAWVYAWIAENRDQRVKATNPLRVRVGDVLDALAYTRALRK